MDGDFPMENHMNKWDDLGGFPPIFGNTSIYIYTYTSYHVYKLPDIEVTFFTLHIIFYHFLWVT